jgi:hypothetical protein
LAEKASLHESFDSRLGVELWGLSRGKTALGHTSGVSMALLAPSSLISPEKHAIAKFRGKSGSLAEIPSLHESFDS